MGVSQLIFATFGHIFGQLLMKKYIFFLILLALLGCSNPDGHPEAKGGRIYGGTLKINETDGYTSLYPYLTTDVVSHDINGQIFEGLIRFNPKNVTRVLPSIAESWQISPDGLTYTFKLKKGVLFQNDACFPDGKGREVDASDFKYSFELLCTASDDNALFETSFKGTVKGADEFYEKSKKGKVTGLEGVKVIDDHTLEIKLLSPQSTFLYVLAGSSGYVIPHEAIEKYGNKTYIGTGPFCWSNASTKDRVILVRNPHYHRSDSIGNQLPFLDTLSYSFIPEKSKELEAFKKGEIHMIFSLTRTAISEMVEAQIADFKSKNPKFTLQRNSELTTQYYQFNITRKPFNDIKVRQAFSYAINRDKIITDVLNSEAFGPGICGLTPPGISGYDVTEIVGYRFNPEKAKKLLEEAGYPDGKNFPHITIEVNSGGGKNIDVVEEVKKQLKQVLNVDIDFTVVSFKQKLEDAKYGKAEMFRSGWTADYPSPENFLRTMYGAGVPDSLNVPAYPNTVRYKNHVFDSLFEKGFAEKRPEDGFTYYMKAEQVMMQDAPLIILWYGENQKMMHSFVRNFYFNTMNYKEFSEVYIKKPVPSNP